MRVQKSFLSGLAAILMLPISYGYAQTQENPPLRLTVYANGLTLVDEARNLISSKSGSIGLTDVTDGIITDSVLLDANGKAFVQEITLDSDILSQHTLLERSLGKTIKVARINPATGVETIEQATVLSISGGLVLKIGNRIETSVPGRLVFDSVPDDLHPRPTLNVTMTTPLKEALPARLAYLTTAFSWDAHYTAVLNADHDRMNLEARAKITSNAGFDIGPANVSLVAGDVSRRSPAPRPKMEMMMATRAMAADAAPAPEATRADLSAFHIYGVPGTLTLKDKGSVQRRLFGADNFAVKRRLEYRGGAPVFGPTRGTLRPEPVSMSILIDNSDGKGLAKPLPAGLVRAYVRDAGGALRFIGEDRVGNVAVGGDARLNLGREFNVTVERKQTDFQRLGDRATEAAFTLTVKNGGQKDETVRVIESIPGDWKILDQSQPHARDGVEARWDVKIPAKGEAKLSYRVRVRR